MPLSAFSPEGPFSLVGLDAMTIENLKKRNREEKLFTAKCCGAPMQIRTAHGRIAHFYHLSGATTCDGARPETAEHLRLKQKIADAIIHTGWDHETEAAHRDRASGRLIWQADVLAYTSKGNATVAFEVQLAKADWNDMLERQERYRQHGVRGLWFVKTKKGFPARRELPVFCVESDARGDWVQLGSRWDSWEMWRDAAEVEQVELSDFIYYALDGNLKWAPYFEAPKTELEVSIGYGKHGICSGCGRRLAQHNSVTMHIAGPRRECYPSYRWHAGMEPIGRTKWSVPAVNYTWDRMKEEIDIAFVSRNSRCCWCGAKANITPYIQNRFGKLNCLLELGELPKPAFGTIEWDWLNRWILQI